MTEKQTINIHGKEYETVASRVARFRDDENNKNTGIITELISVDNNRVVMKASIVTPTGVILATGHAEELRDSTTINKTSALENCETSAIGRALAAFGMAGTEYASADEVAQAIRQQSDPAFNTAYIQDIPKTPPQQIKAEHLSGAIADTPIDDETFKELNFLPGKLNLPKDVSKEVWNQLYQLGVYRGKFDFAGTKTWSGTKISKSQIPLIVKAFAKAANYDEEQTQILIQQFVGDEQIDPSPVEQYSDEPF